MSQFSAMTGLECSTPSVEVRMAIWGKEIDRLDTDEVVEILASRLRRETAHPLALGWINSDHPNHVGQNGQEWLLLAEGMPNAWRGQLLTAKGWPRVTAADLLPKVLRQAEKCGSRVAFLGGTAEGHQRLAARLASEYPSLALTGMWPSPPHMSAIQSASLADEIRSARTDVLVVSLGKDRGQHWVDCYGSATGARVLLPFGALRSSRRTNRDVFYRLMREPRRLVCRYLIQGPIALARAISAQLFLSEGVHFVAASTREATAAPAAPARVSTGRP
jgi:N-acetylglucosaminyldiphosphoundecaprenol N-acetyl-beta-D-mannosaminyltransferase